MISKTSRLLCKNLQSTLVRHMNDLRFSIVISGQAKLFDNQRVIHMMTRRAVHQRSR